MRQARDAIEKANLGHGSAAFEEDLINIFRGQDIDWGFFVQVGLPQICQFPYDDPECHHGAETVQLTLHGPGAYDGCSTGGVDGGEVPRQGGIPNSSWGDCHVTFPQMSIAYPYLADQSHLDGPYTITATYTCRVRPSSGGEGEGGGGGGEFCPDSHVAYLILARSVGTPHQYGGIDGFPLTVSNQGTPVVRLNPAGEAGAASGSGYECTILINNTDCSR